MARIFPLKLQQVSSFLSLGFLLTTFFYCQNLWAIQDALVTADKAVIYADEQLSAPIGFIRKGKKIKVGDIPRNRAQVYPIIVSGKIAYVRVVDISTETESMDSNRLVAERFKKGTEEEQKTNYSFSVFSYATQVTLAKENSTLKNKDPVDWYGASLRGGVQVSPRWDLDLLINFLNAKAEKEVFRSIEFGVGSALRMYDKGRFKLRLLAQLLAVPFSTYSVGEDFRVNGYGYSLGGGLSATYRLGKNWGLETYGGFYYSKLMGFNVPEPYQKISPSFVGTRLGLGLNYQF